MKLNYTSVESKSKQNMMAMSKKRISTRDVRDKIDLKADKHTIYTRRNKNYDDAESQDESDK